MSIDALRYGLDELAQLGGVSRRTIRYYVQESLLPEPLGVGRGRHYGREHLDALLRIKTMQEAGRSLDEIRQSLRGKGGHRTVRAATAWGSQVRSLWRRLVVAPGVELHVSSEAPLPSAAALEELAEWCRVHLGRSGGEHDASH